MISIYTSLYIHTCSRLCNDKNPHCIVLMWTLFQNRWIAHSLCAWACWTCTSATLTRPTILHSIPLLQYCLTFHIVFWLLLVYAWGVGVSPNVNIGLYEFSFCRHLPSLSPLIFLWPMHLGRGWSCQSVVYPCLSMLPVRSMLLRWVVEGYLWFCLLISKESSTYLFPIFFLHFLGYWVYGFLLMVFHIEAEHYHWHWAPHHSTLDLSVYIYLTIIQEICIG